MAVLTVINTDNAGTASVADVPQQCVSSAVFSPERLTLQRFLGSAELLFVPLSLITLRLPRAVHPLKVFFTFNAHLEFSYFSY
jgi:hypothetical protein